MRQIEGRESVSRGSIYRQWLALNYGVGREPRRFQLHATAHDNDAIESQAEFGAIPGDELIDRKLIDPARTRGSEAVEHGHFGNGRRRGVGVRPDDIQFDFSLAHAGGPPLRSMELRHRRVWAKSWMALFWNRNKTSLSEIWLRQLSPANRRLHFSPTSRRPLSEQN